MCELFSFSTPRDGQVDVWRSPVDQMLRLSNAVPPTTSLKQAHLIEHCLVEAHRSAVVKDGGTILGTTTAARVTVTLIFSADVDLRKYHSLLDINVTPELVEKIFPLIIAARFEPALRRMILLFPVSLTACVTAAAVLVYTRTFNVFITACVLVAIFIATYTHHINHQLELAHTKGVTHAHI